MCDRLAFAGNIFEDGDDGPAARVSSFPDRIDAHTEGAAEQPQNADRDPASEELLAEDVSAAILEKGQRCMTGGNVQEYLPWASARGSVGRGS